MRIRPRAGAATLEPVNNASSAEATGGSNNARDGRGALDEDEESNARAAMIGATAV